MTSIDSAGCERLVTSYKDQMEALIESLNLRETSISDKESFQSVIRHNLLLDKTRDDIFDLSFRDVEKSAITALYSKWRFELAGSAIEYIQGGTYIPYQDRRVFPSRRQYYDPTAKDSSTFASSRSCAMGRVGIWQSR
jgi:hypothetical protein